MISGATAAIAGQLRRPLRQFTEWKAGGGVLLLIAAAIAMLLANSRFHASVDAFWETHRGLGVGGTALSLTTRSWIGDGLMACFFLLVGLEIKREVLDGELSTLRTASLPLAAAFGGMVVPALLFLAVNQHGRAADGWPIPMATDIAFALGILSLLGSRVPPSLTVFLAALAIADDLGAVVVIGFVSGHSVDASYLLPVALVLGALALVNRRRVGSLAVYALLGVALWYLVLRSGLHPTLAGILLAFAVPARSLGTSAPQQSPLTRLEHWLQRPVNYVVLPMFALANAGVPLGVASTAGASDGGGVTAGVMLGLIVGKPIGILCATWIAVRSGATLPAGASWSGMTGVALLAGIGFTMSLFMSQLVFGDGAFLQQAKLGIVCASVVAAVAGAMVMRLAPVAPGGRSPQ